MHGVRVCCVCACANELVSVTMNEIGIYTSGREKSIRKGVPRLRVFVVPLTFRRFALASTGSGSSSGTALALNPDRDGASASAVAALSDTRGGEGGASSPSSSEQPVGS